MSSQYHTNLSKLISTLSINLEDLSFAFSCFPDLNHIPTENKILIPLEDNLQLPQLFLFNKKINFRLMNPDLIDEILDLISEFEVVIPEDYFFEEKIDEDEIRKYLQARY